MLLSPTAIPVCQLCWRYSQQIAHDDQLVNQGCTANTQLLPTTTGGEYGGRGDRNLLVLFQFSYQFKILHDRQIWKATDRLKERCLQENSLITVRHLE